MEPIRPITVSQGLSLFDGVGLFELFAGFLCRELPRFAASRKEVRSRRLPGRRRKGIAHSSVETRRRGRESDSLARRVVKSA